jgi:Lon protease-like protein
MTSEAIAGGRLIAVVLLKVGWEKDYFGNPPIHEVATVGHVESYEELPEGRYNIVLEGVEKVRLVDTSEGREPDETRRLYRVGWTVAAPERLPATGSSVEVEFRLRLRSLWKQLVERPDFEPEQFGIPPHASFEEVVNRIASFADLPPRGKQSLLELDDLLERARALESILEEQILHWKAVNRFRVVGPSDPRLN